MPSITTYTRRAPRLGNVLLDCAIHESHTFTAQIARLPVESGTQISDHRHIDLPGPIVIEGIVGGRGRCAARVHAPDR
jgi:hypothetical protein